MNKWEGESGTAGKGRVALVESFQMQMLGAKAGRGDRNSQDGSCSTCSSHDRGWPK